MTAPAAPVRCLHCLDGGITCEEHPQYPAFATVEGHREHAAGMPCPFCCPEIPQDGRHSITEAFTPDWMREP